jgi:pimeloyl-ACP methyl ester carboxylesterase
MQVLYVHGMGRSPISGLPMRIRLGQHGFDFDSFHYLVSVESFASARDRLLTKLKQVARSGEYVVVGHSLGGVLLRAALSQLPSNVVKPACLFLLGSPTSPSRLAKLLGKRLLYRLLTGDCGQLLGSEERMARIPAAGIPTVAIVGNRGLHGRWTPFGEEENDGIVAASESRADWAQEVIKVPVIHALQPSSWLIADIIVDKLEQARAHAAHASAH